MNLEEAAIRGTEFLIKQGGYLMCTLDAVERPGELWSCIYEIQASVGPKERVEILIGEDRIMGFRKLK